MGVQPSRADRVRGCLWGGAVGDAWGSAFEGRAQGAGGRSPWRFTDDTQLTAATCEAILAAGRVDPSVIARHFAAWFTSGRLTGLGASTLKALNDLSVGAHWALAGARGPNAAGNGAAMRIAPLAAILDPGTAGGRDVIRDVSRITHHHDEAYVAALAMTLAVRAALDDTPLPLATLAAQLHDSRVRDRLQELAALPDQPIPEVAARFGATGFAADSVPLALYAAAQLPSQGFEGVLAHLTTVHGDVDTIASMAGQVMGAQLGAAALPAPLLARLPDWDALALFDTFAKWSDTDSD